MAIISSTYKVGTPQADGRIYVDEIHTNDDGEQYTFSYLAEPNHDFQTTLHTRAARLNEQLVRRAAAIAQGSQATLPLSKLDFLSRFTPQERIAVRQASKTDPIVEDFLAMLDVAGNVVPTHPTTQQGLGYLVSQGLLTAERASTIGA